MEYPDILLVTVTGWRPKAFEICEKLIARQTYPRDRIDWVVVNDDNGKTACTLNQAKFNSSLIWQPGYNTQRINWMTALPYIDASNAKHIFAIEDDDYLSPTYLDKYVRLLQDFDIVGEGNIKYYNLPTKTCKEIGNYEHTSLAATGFNRSLLPLFKKALHSGEPYFDLKLWEYAKEEGVGSLIFCNKNLSVGMKGLPGRPGIGLGHRPAGWDSDPFGKKLMDWCGDGWKLYEEFLVNKR